MQFRLHVIKEAFCLGKHSQPLTVIVVKEVKWQARRDSNPQHPVLETGALAVRATGLQKSKTLRYTA